MTRQDQLMTEPQLGEALHVCRDALRKFRNDPRDPLPALRAGRRWLYDWDKVQRWLQRQGKRAVRAQT